MIEFDTRYLKAMAKTAASDPTRFTLHSVLMENTGGSVRLTGTDGRALTTILLKATSDGSILPSNGVMIPLPAISLAGTSKKVRLTQLQAPYWGLNGQPFKPVEGIYPDYRQVIRDHGLKPGFGESAIAADLAHRMFGVVRSICPKGHCRVYYSGEMDPLVIRFQSPSVDGVSIIMPVHGFYTKSEDTSMIPAWVHQK